LLTLSKKTLRIFSEALRCPHRAEQRIHAAMGHAGGAAFKSALLPENRAYATYAHAPENQKTSPARAAVAQW
jgi:hypothetical protein